MRALLIATGNPLRGDDAVAHAVLELIPPSPAFDTLALIQLTPEVSAQIAAYDLVIFLDADVLATEVRLGQVEESVLTPGLTHVSSPAEIVALARVLYAFTGRTLACRLPIGGISPGEPLTPHATLSAAQAAQLLLEALAVSHAGLT